MLSNVFYDSMLLNFNDKSSYDSISSYGYAFGYLGGGIAFVLSILFLVMNKGPDIDLVTNKKIVFIFASLWWMLFMLPLVFNWKDTDKQ